ncbi:hypothetical protein K504DRAFT_249814 [Pleomassaria siparia CBS 279.74]|uniref:Uncharacterized protein n=1 Tax=Pleomassaria siparia CBS 279.74 TaxID=1314801 RepID=A0A6G1KB76_9PLEO|nr:hypothetical protein K504DRAFT_249814 [Pleomassaria siparia CBS 279.74]
MYSTRGRCLSLSLSLSLSLHLDTSIDTSDSCHLLTLTRTRTLISPIQPTLPPLTCVYVGPDKQQPCSPVLQQPHYFPNIAMHASILIGPTLEFPPVFYLFIYIHCPRQSGCEYYSMYIVHTLLCPCGGRRGGRRGLTMMKCGCGLVRINPTRSFLFQTWP